MKVSAKTKLVAVGIVALVGIGGGVLYHQTFETNPVVVNEQRSSGTEAAIEDSSTVEKPKPSQADIETAIAALKNLDAMDRLNKTHTTDESASTEEVKSLTAQPPASLSGEEPTSVRIKKLEAQFNDLNQKFVEKFRITQEFRGLLKEHNGKGRRALIEELKRLQRLQIEASNAGQHEVANEIKERSRQVNQNYGTSGKELVDTIEALKKESRPIAKQMKAIKVELQSLRNPR